MKKLIIFCLFCFLILGCSQEPQFQENGNLAVSLDWEVSQNSNKPINQTSSVPSHVAKIKAIVTASDIEPVIEEFTDFDSRGIIKVKVGANRNLSLEGYNDIDSIIYQGGKSSIDVVENLVTEVEIGMRKVGQWIRFGSIESFNPTPVGESDTKIMKIENPGTELLEISEISFSSDGIFSVPRSLPVQIEANGLTEFPITFTPDENKTYNSTLTIISNAVNQPELTVELTAQGI
jgi:hypothetical protein